MIDKLKNVALEAALDAGVVTMGYFRDAPSVTSKGNDHASWDPVTQADQEAEKAMRRIIEAHFPNHGIIGEEFGTKHAQSDYEWIIDPIDGTRAYIAGLPMWGILIGVLYQKKPIFGLMAQPFVGDVFFGDTKNAYLKTGNKEIKLRTSSQESLSKARMFCTTPDMFDTDALMRKFLSLKSACLNVRYGTDCYGYGAMAAGWGDCVFEANVQNYDIMPLIPIIQGAGGCVSAPDGTPFVTGEVIASANKVLHQQMIDLLSENKP